MKIHPELEKYGQALIKDRADKWGRTARRNVRKASLGIIWDSLSIMRNDYKIFSIPGVIDMHAKNQLRAILRHLFELKGNRLRLR